MAWSISVTLTAHGDIEVTATDCAGGVPYTVACGKADTRGHTTTPRVAAEMTVAAIQWDIGGIRAIGEGCKSNLIRAVRRLFWCLPYPEDFTEDGRPCRS